MHSFYWVTEGALAGCGRPGGSGGRRAGAEEEQPEGLALLDDDLAWLRRQDIGALLSLTETALPQEALARHAFTVLHLPVADLTAPTPLQLTHALGFIDMQRALGRGVAVHCRMGQGRAATVLAAYLIRGGLTPDRALGRMRVLCPGAIGSAEQEQALHAFARRRDWIV